MTTTSTPDSVTFTARRTGVSASTPMAVHTIDVEHLAVFNAHAWSPGDEVLIGVGPFLTLGAYVSRTAKGHKVQLEGYPKPHLVTYVLPNVPEFRA